MSRKERFHWIHFTPKGLGAEVTRWAWGRHPPKAFKTEQGVRRAGLGLVQALDWAPRNRISGGKGEK